MSQVRSEYPLLTKAANTKRRHSINFIVNRRFAVGSAGWLIAVVLLRQQAGAENVHKEPDHFDFRYFGSLPQSEIETKAKEFLNRKFPSGSAVESVTKELTEAGAKCVERKGLKEETFFGCYYEKSGRGFPSMFVTAEWKIIIYPDLTETKVARIEVGWGLTGL